jgi:two-component system response regulator RegA
VTDRYSEKPFTERQIDAMQIRLAVGSVSLPKEQKMLDTTENRSMLIVEDDDALRDRLAAAMQKRGFETRKAASVAEGLDHIKQKAPDFAVVDLRLLDGSGLDVIKSLELRKPQARAIILTGYGDIPTAVAAARIGAVDYIAKPATTDEIVDVLLAPRDQSPPAPEHPMSPEDARIEHIEHVFQGAGGNVSQAARLLNMHRRTLQRILKRNGVVADASQ